MSVNLVVGMKLVGYLTVGNGIYDVYRDDYGIMIENNNDESFCFGSVKEAVQHFAFKTSEQVVYNEF